MIVLLYVLTLRWGVVACRRRLTEEGMYRLASPPSGVLHNISHDDVLSVQS
jgi:hypothetical protein